MLQFLKTLFQKEEPLTQETIPAADLESWFNQKLSQIDFQQEITNFFQQLTTHNSNLKEKLTTLETAEIDEKEKQRVEERVQNIVLGHKDNYCREMKRFTENIDLPQQPNLQTTIQFNSNLNQQLTTLAQRTAKSYQASQHLFFHPTEDVFKVVGEINLLNKKFSEKLQKQNLHQIQELQNKLRHLNEEKKKRQRLEEDLKWKQTKLDRHLDGKNRQEEEISQLSESDDYLELKNIKEDESQHQAQIKENHDEIHLFFSKLSRALRKYQKITLEKELVKEYLEDPIIAFIDDENLKIENILKTLEKAIKKEELQLDQKNKTTALELIQESQDGFLQNLKQQQLQLQKQENKFQTKLKAYNVDNLLEEAEYKQEHFEDQITQTQREIEELKVKLQSLGEQKLQEEIKELIKTVLKVELTFSAS